jgi:choline dehydrogenase-like flavoprotein
MHLDLDLDTPTELVGDVAVIGAGAAGITVVRRLLQRGLSVILLESGGLDYEEKTADLNGGVNAGQPYYDLEDARLRLFGGTTAIWGGRCAELDPIDFTARPWVPHSGWPFGIDALRSYYQEAWRSLDLPAAPPPAEVLNGDLPHFLEDELTTPLWLFDGEFDRFSFRRCRDIVTHERCTVVTHATVREIKAAPSGRGIERLDVRSLTGRTLDVRARDFVLAAGGIETPRLLLCSRSVHGAGLGNQHDQVGRYFMEHPHARGGRVLGGSAWTWLAAFKKRRVGGLDLAPLIAPSPRLQAREGLLNTSLTIAGRRPLHGKEALLMRAYLHAKHRLAPTRKGRAMWRLTKQVVGRAQNVVDPLRPWLLNKAGRLDVALVIRGEQAPNPDSRVRLADDRDALGMPRAVLEWRTSALDVDSAAGLVAALGRESKRLGLGQVEPAAWLSEPGRTWVTDPLISTHPIAGYHHMGTARMANDPRRGVTDRETRVHGVGNLYVAGSALFPTSGWANPTLTIIALALRTADRIAASAPLAGADVRESDLSTPERPARLQRGSR